MTRHLIAAIAAGLFSVSALAQFTVTEPWVRATVPAQKSTGAFMQLQSATPARLLEVRTPVAGRAEKVIVYSYSATSSIWFKGIANKIERAKNVSVINIPADISAQLEKMASRSMALQCTIQDGQVWLTDGTDTVLVEREALRGAV